LKHRYGKQNIDLIMTTDDKALEFALKHRSEIFSSAPIVFCGVNRKNAGILTASFSNVTGILEVLDPYNTVKTALSLNPSLKDIYLVYDNTESGLSAAEESLSSMKRISKKLNIIHLNKKTHAEIIELSKSLGKNSMILVTSYYMDSAGIVMSYEEFCSRLSRVSAVPIYNLFDFALGSGVTGGSMMNGRLHGTNATKVALAVCNGKDINKIQIQNVDSVKYYFDYNLLKKFNISMGLLPKGSTIVNKPFSFFETYQTLVLITLSIICLLILFLMILSYYLNKNRKMKLQLELDNNELNALYEENAAAEETLREQYENLEEAQGKLAYSAYHDSLTGLYNRACMKEKIDKRISEIKSLETNDAMLFIDIDNFKYINDSMGHSFGDKLLIHISQRLKSTIEENHLLFRLGGDEFIVYSLNHTDKDSIHVLAKKLLQLLREPVNIDGNILSITASIGIAVFPEDAENIHELLQYSDMAMYMAKKNNKNNYYFFNSGMNAELIHRVNVEKQFQSALKENEFQLYYQPLVRPDSMGSVGIVGFEALIRWNSKELGLVLPDEFISIAEETGYIIELGEWVLRNSCIFIRDLNVRNCSNYVINVNISPIQLLQQDFGDMISRVMVETGLEPSLLEIEITESVIMNSTDAMIQKLSLLRSKGIAIAIDDFGTGHSSLARLKTLPITTIKIDKSFIDNITDENDCNAITETIIELGHKLKLKIIAEGVETPSQLAYLSKNHCDIIQGYLFYKPMPEEQVKKLLF
jgi:diguanylate cyclase (GGDEF)-like protein